MQDVAFFSKKEKRKKKKEKRKARCSHLTFGGVDVEVSLTNASIKIGRQST